MDAIIFGIAFLYISSHVDRNNSSGCMQADKSDSFWQQLLHRSPGHRQLHITDGQPPVLSSHSNCGFTSDNCQHEMKQTSWQSQPCTFLRRCRHRWGEASQHANKLAKSTSRLPPTNNKHQKKACMTVFISCETFCSRVVNFVCRLQILLLCVSKGRRCKHDGFQDDPCHVLRWSC
jgi:hypothetical protein